MRLLQVVIKLILGTRHGIMVSLTQANLAQAGAMWEEGTSIEKRLLSDCL